MARSKCRRIAFCCSSGLTPLREASSVIRNSGTAPLSKLSSSSATRRTIISTSGNCAIISGLVLEMEIASPSEAAVQ